MHRQPVESLQLSQKKERQWCKNESLSHATPPRQCSRCKAIWYTSAACQRADWRQTAQGGVPAGGGGAAGWRRVSAAAPCLPDSASIGPAGAPGAVDLIACMVHNNVCLYV
jgi:hypothetical protein